MTKLYITAHIVCAPISLNGKTVRNMMCIVGPNLLKILLLLLCFVCKLLTLYILYIVQNVDLKEGRGQVIETSWLNVFIHTLSVAFKCFEKCYSICQIVCNIQNFEGILKLVELVLQKTSKRTVKS